ncbi:MAG: DEAD/DEAH box helicase [Calditrichaceae bacterium]
MTKSIFEKSGFHPVVTSWFNDTFSKPSPPQIKGWPVIASGKHTLIFAPTGSGKTLAAFLWCIDHLFRLSLQSDPEIFSSNPGGVHTLYISPLKALNNDIERNLQAPLQGIAKYAAKAGITAPKIRAAVRTGDTPANVRQSMLKRPPHILITTPESLYLLLTSDRGRMLFRRLKYIIVDEIHNLSGSKRGVHLSLSLERLNALCETSPIRIGLSATQKPLERIAAFLGGRESALLKNHPEPRPVEIIDCGLRKDMDIRVLSPVESFGDLPDATVWHDVYNTLYDLIRRHRTTLIFANMRAQTEKIARQLNDRYRNETGNPDAVIALAHHGSISREERYKIESDLKAGQIPAVIATASLELGIDIGSIDLVIQLEAPKSVSTALQRVGRSGHLLHATSKGRIIPLYPSDIDDAVAMAYNTAAGAIEETVIPENALDVLAQQITAEVSMREWPRHELYRQMTSSYCYRHLTENAFNRVLDMLSGQYADSPLRALQQRLNWDKVNDNLIARRGSRLTAVMNGGTIPDRGYYGVYLDGENVKLGEMEEEFVFESRVGDIFFLGNNEWQINEIRQDRMIVSPRSDIKPRAPFWKGDILYRGYSTSLQIAAFRSELTEKIEHHTAETWLENECHADPFTTKNLLQYYQKQKEHSAVIATDKTFVLEWFADASGEPLMMLHAPLGARVNGAWAIALSTAIERTANLQAQYTYDDDNILIRLLDTEEAPDFEALFRLTAEDIEELLVSSLIDTHIFSIRFRYNAARALLLPRSRPGTRIPLWLQRLRASDLLQTVRKYPDFPIIAETYRDCLNDVFDLDSLKQVIGQIRDGSIRIRYVNTPYPSPMASGILFKFLSDNIYESDRSRQAGKPDASAGELLNEILNNEKIPSVVSRTIVEQAERRWQHLDLAFQAHDREALYSIIEKLGPVSSEELAKRAADGFQDWIDDLNSENRIFLLKGNPGGWIATSDKKLYSNPGKNGHLRKRIQKLMRIRGPVTEDEILLTISFSDKEVLEILDRLHKEKELVRGKLIAGENQDYWCDRQNFAELYRTTIGGRRRSASPVPTELFFPFSLAWHRIDKPGQSVADILNHYQGYHFPLNFFEQEILYSRFCPSNPSSLGEPIEKLYGFIHNGEIILRIIRGAETGRRMIQFIPRSGGNLFYEREFLTANNEKLTDQARIILSFLRENGASLFRDMEAGADLAYSDLTEALSVLVNRGLISCDDPDALYGILKSGQNSERSSQLPEAPPWARSQRRPRLNRSAIKKMVSGQIQLKKGRWFTLDSFAVLGKNIDDPLRAERQARMLLRRYGILVKEWYRREAGLVPWYRIFQVLKRLEWQGEIRRGYFIKGLSGVQFALPEALDLLEKIQAQPLEDNSSAISISATDPSMPLGGAVSWNILNKNGNSIPVTRQASNHLIFLNGRVIAYTEQYGDRIHTTANFSPDLSEALCDVIKNWLKLPAALTSRQRMEISLIDGKAAVKSLVAQIFIKKGFEINGDKLVLWPSAL